MWLPLLAQVMAQDPPPSNGRLSTLVVTNLIKVGGLILAMKEGLGPEVRPGTLAVAAFMMAGAQGFENLLMRLFDRNGHP